MLNHVAIPPRWKEYFYHVGSSFTVNSIRQTGIIAVGTDTEEERQTVFFTAVGCIGDDIDDEYDDLTTPQELHKIKDYNSGRPDLAPFSCCDSVLVDHQIGQYIVPKDSYATISSSNCAEKMFGNSSTTKKCSNNQAPKESCA